jgi:hypothetical protein
MFQHVFDVVDDELNGFLGISAAVGSQEGGRKVGADEGPDDPFLPHQGTLAARPSRRADAGAAMRNRGHQRLARAAVSQNDTFELPGCRRTAGAPGPGC